jgi:hypothetical protein
MFYRQETAFDFDRLSHRDFQPGEPLKQSLSSASSDSTESIVSPFVPQVREPAHSMILFAESPRVSAHGVSVDPQGCGLSAPRKSRTTPLRYAVMTGRAECDPTVDLRGTLGSVVRRNRSAMVDPSRRGELMRAIAG